MYRILKDSPARRDQYEKCSNKNDDTDQPTYPLPFFTVRWVENKPVAAEALDCWSNFKAYMRWWETQPPSKKPKTIPPLTHSCSITQIYFFVYMITLGYFKVIYDRFLNFSRKIDPTWPNNSNSFIDILIYSDLIF